MLHQLHAAEVQFQHDRADLIHDEAVRRHIDEQTAGRRFDRVRLARAVRGVTAAWPRPIVTQSAVRAA
jgi:hypothetical protein